MEYLMNTFGDTFQYTCGNTFRKTTGKFCSRANTQMNLSYKLWLVLFVFISLSYFKVTNGKHFMINLLLSTPLGMTQRMLQEMLLQALNDVKQDFRFTEIKSNKVVPLNKKCHELIQETNKKLITKYCKNTI